MAPPDPEGEDPDSQQRKKGAHPGALFRCRRVGKTDQAMWVVSMSPCWSGVIGRRISSGSLWREKKEPRLVVTGSPRWLDRTRPDPFSLLGGAGALAPRWARYRGQGKVLLQGLLTGLVVNVKRLVSLAGAAAGCGAVRRGWVGTG